MRPVEAISQWEVDLKKVMLLAAMLAMVLAAAVPALAQSVTQVGQGNVACVQTAVQQETGKTQIAVSQYGDATNINIQAIAQQCNISVTQVNAVFAKFAKASATASASAPTVQYKKAAPAVQYAGPGAGAKPTVT